MPTYKFRYFNARGLGEVSRLLFALAGQEYEDVRFTKDQWAAEKPNTPFGQMPVLEVDGKAYSQSGAIHRYLARKFGFYGKTDIEGLEIEQVLGIGQDIMTARMKSRFEKDETRKAEFEKELKEVKLPLLLGMFEKILTENGTGLFVGDQITLADVYVYDLCQKLDAVTDFADYPNTKKCRETVGANAKINEWVSKRPDTEM